MTDKIEINPDKEKLNQPLIDNPVLYHITKEKIALTIEGRFRPTSEERELMFEVLKMNGLDFEE